MPPDVSGTAIIGTQPSNTRLRITHRRRVTGGMDWFRFNQVINGGIMIGWIADVNGFVEGEVGSPGIPMPPNAEHPQPWIDSRAVSLRNPDYIPGHTTGPHRPFYATRSLNEINQIIIHHTASPTTLTRMDIEVGWRGLGWWNGGYHEMIHADGTVEVCYNPEVVTNGAYGQNGFSYHICLIGDFRVGGSQPSIPQMHALTRRMRLWQSRLGIPTAHIVAHSERVPTICPGVSGSVLRNLVDVINDSDNLFIVTSNGDMEGSIVYTDPRTNSTQLRTLEVGTTFNSLDQRIVSMHEMPDNAPPGNSGANWIDTWQMIGENEWV